MGDRGVGRGSGRGPGRGRIGGCFHQGLGGICNIRDRKRVGFLGGRRRKKGGFFGRKMTKNEKK